MRMTPIDRKAAILEAAIVAASRYGFSNMRLHHVAGCAECSTALVIIHYDTMQWLRHLVMRAAIKRRHLTIIANGIVNGDTTALGASAKLRKEALASLSA